MGLGGTTEVVPFPSLVGPSVRRTCGVLAVCWGENHDNLLGKRAKRAAPFGRLRSSGRLVGFARVARIPSAESGQLLRSQKRRPQDHNPTTRKVWRRIMGLENVNRGQHVKVNGTQCGSPARRGRG